MAEKKIKMIQEEQAKNIAESIRAVAEHIIQCADNYARGINDDTIGIKITMDFRVDALPTVTFTQDVCPRTWINAVHDGRCRIWTKEGRMELSEPMEEGLYCVDVAVFKGEPNAADRDVSVKVWARDRDEAAQKAREIVGRSGERVKVLRVWREQK